LNYGPQASPSPVQSDKEILQQCRAAVQELVFRRESEDLLKKKVDEIQRISGLKDERIEILQNAVAEYEKAMEARKKAETVVEALRQNYEAQIKSVERELARARRNGRLFGFVGVILGAGAVLLLRGN
jgi:chromosome segregation ATPase